MLAGASSISVVLVIPSEPPPKPAMTAWAVASSVIDQATTPTMAAVPSWSDSRVIVRRGTLALRKGSSTRAQLSQATPTARASSPAVPTGLTAMPAATGRTRIGQCHRYNE